MPAGLSIDFNIEFGGFSGLFIHPSFFEPRRSDAFVQITIRST
jgi:hypothetical protein